MHMALNTEVQAFRQNAREKLNELFGFDDFKQGQLDVLTALFEHQASLALFPTGGGKSICYQLYSQLGDSGLTLVVSPLIALMKDQVDDLRKKGVLAARIDSSLNPDEHYEIKSQLRSGALRLLYVSPERFNNESFILLISGIKIRLFAVDEAHCISQWGHNFRPDYLKLVQYAERIKAEAVLALTATATPAVVKDIQSALKISEAASIINSAYRPNLFIDIRPTSQDDRFDALLDSLRQNPPGTTIVYATFQHSTEVLAEALKKVGLLAHAYHAGLDADLRAVIQENWTQGDSEIVVATIAFGMGIDKADVRYIYHYDLPKSLENYVQEIGRAGRDGKESKVTVLGNAEDLPKLAAFTLGDTPSESDLFDFASFILQQDEHFELSLYHTSRKFDFRPLSLATILTYLELMGILKQITPKYSTYRITYTKPESDFYKQANAATVDFYKQLFSAAKRGTIHITLDLDEAVAKTGFTREKILRSLSYLESSGFGTTKSSGLLHRYTLLDRSRSANEISRALFDKFVIREKNDLERLEQVLSFLEASECKSNYIKTYFGEKSYSSCGHCAWCIEPNVTFDVSSKKNLPRPSIFLSNDQIQELKALKESHRQLLKDDRKIICFLLGINSPAISLSKLSKHNLFGVLGGFAYQDVVAFVGSDL